MNHTTTAKTTTRLGIITATVAIAIVTLALITAALVPVQTAHASCVSSPKGDQACSGGSPITGANSFSTSRGVGGIGANAESGPSGSLSQSFSTPLPPTPPIEHQSSSHNFGGQGNCADRTCSG